MGHFHTESISAMSSRVWFITGCSSGFGQELALEALSRGDKVIATARNKDKLKILQEAGAETMELDVKATLYELRDVASRVIESHGRLDVLVNNAGYGLQGTVEEITYDVWSLK